MADEVKTKVCRCCGYEGSILEEFVKKENLCKKCESKLTKAYRDQHLTENKAYSAQWRSANKEKIKADKAAEYRANSEYIKTRVAKHKAENPEKKKILDRNWREKNKERKRENDKQWRLQNPDRKAVSHRKRRASKLGIPGFNSLEDIDELYIEQIGRCVYCGDQLRNVFHVDHIIPVSEVGSTNWPSNLQLLCPSCNCSKGSKSNDEFVVYRKTIGQVVYAEAA